ncbi:4-hydroxy-tetrahydrodipicolinate synthase [Candidatus Desantisbacteria bacterium CG1_02_38_46]|uniref:4-hydroxy-tetrahydrodipicolinate synthase n=3 Tax=unclassified Candidatus Desantisiibacteriota TaxID=3106372 RepID=A0A2H9P984_9BACT|nr:MAG: 4-hydroxy-tetrahydrodipicolinate synthase [Candidatus Desantisbacteria bacterium CG1_02_38_46]PIU51159.1 MAG: 4-hydroxy-tetrahydrodipicolinate synthase [Candidatus Desantisbacteria bacterium CG07_land_8_20_14_0_80_39_15]PIZ14756.1 MAG: 4-hydroxy-tetrahydrodipicolinate synthase [Candidatus Desantisbacteria bacterium CG_4_10_14_0_8_um_filter_39_17]
MFQGSFVALITPFKNGKVDEDKLRELVEFHIKNGTMGIVPCGTTGESPTLSHEEHKRVIKIVIEQSRKRIPVIAGTGSNSTAEALDLTRDAKENGADACLVLCPYYNRPTQKGMYLHFKEIATKVHLPIIIYNIPSRTGVNLEPQTLANLNAEYPNIVGVKEASGIMDQVSMIIKLCSKDFCVLSGDDSMTLPIMSLGGKGVISVVANILPGEIADMVEKFLKGDIEGARLLHYRLFPLVKVLFIETNPIPVKTAMSLLKMDTGEMRLPLSPMSEENLAKLKKAMQDYGLL